MKTVKMMLALVLCSVAVMVAGCPSAPACNTFVDKTNCEAAKSPTTNNACKWTPTPAACNSACTATAQSACQATTGCTWAANACTLTAPTACTVAAPTAANCTVANGCTFVQAGGAAGTAGTCAD